MATRAEIARALAQRSKPKSRAKTAGRERDRAHRREAELRVFHELEHAVSGRPAGGVTARRNIRADSGDHATFDLEDSGNGRPSRKSTRKGANRVKPDANLRRRHTRASHSPERRAGKDAAAAKKAGGKEVRSTVLQVPRSSPAGASEPSSRPAGSRKSR